MGTVSGNSSGKSGRRTRLSPQRRRAQLIELGVELLASRPLEQISVEDIADRAGVSRGLLFHYFASKHDFHVAVVQHISSDMLERTAPDENLDPMEMLRGTVVAYVDYVTERPGTYVSMLRGSVSADPDMRSVFEATRRAMVERTVTHLPSIGIDPDATVRLAVRGWVAFVEDITIAWLQQQGISTSPGPDDPEGGSALTREQFVDLAVAALPAVVASAQFASSG
ncbi:TetR/AcrR family transcriptional regulator [Rhodococcus coprophilus]|uniref:Tetr family transcriptional regulator n=1 Tax=Rhodococcus coprophilus TaxID=38310 RepID=A0A2X4TSU8_9NOCA|nr:TetR/AcrR family transcriptional regulator [Rhodococcus coprophilus]MBM7457642.1 AcrR family transcriptional regulator [Rhodococcus coprophilus]SQI30101.1 tetr family transcriptional regulator [Rhodococcus coprophilus]